ncbi:F0F1 ATP synthase subunit A [Enterococcus nangangensis]|uniref:F0F1 ATP synthase subunit A n=1 Tax=Enterococcus nangangensis TaxID=2559926 RepID=UPI0010F53123|nr:F0F1 ATP synthase subunit A [Enterococcus nangangensis]
MDEKSLVFHIGPVWFDGTVCLMVLLTCLIIFLLVYAATRNLQLKPKGKQNAIEYLVDFIRGIVNENLPKDQAGNLFLFAFVLFLFIIVANTVGLVTKVVTPGETTLWKSPTADPIVTLTLSMTVVLLSNFYGLKTFGIKGYFINSFIKPVAFLSPIKVMEEFTNVLSLGLRLYGNIYAGEVLLTLVAKLAMMLPPVGFIISIPLEVIWIGFSIFIGAIQAYIFVTLSSVYIGHKVEVAE